jgi:hypothetical protein
MRDLVIGRHSLLLFWVRLSCAACTHNWDTASPAAGQLAAESTRVYRVTIVGATIDGSRPDGSPWNTKKPNKTWTFIGIAAGLAVGQATIGKEVGSWLDGDARAYPPAPLVEINVGGASTRQQLWSQRCRLNGTRICRGADLARCSYDHEHSECAESQSPRGGHNHQPCDVRGGGAREWPGNASAAKAAGRGAHDT